MQTPSQHILHVMRIRILTKDQIYYRRSVRSRGPRTYANIHPRMGHKQSLDSIPRMSTQTPQSGGTPCFSPRVNVWLCVVLDILIQSSPDYRYFCVYSQRGSACEGYTWCYLDRLAVVISKGDPVNESGHHNYGNPRSISHQLTKLCR